jgi:hypothetical protein
MPTVRTYGQRQVLPSAVPGVRKQSAETEISTGAGLQRAKAQTGQAIARVGETLFGVAVEQVEKERIRADNTALLEAENELARWEHKRLYDPSTGALTVKGKDAMPLPETVSEEFNTLSGDIAKRLVTPRQRELFAKMRVNHGLNLDLTLRRHVAGEMERYAAGELEANVQNHVNEAIANANDPARIGEQLNHALAAIAAGGPQAGMGPEALEAAAAAVKTETHAGVVKRLLAQNKDKAAKAYFEETKDQIDGEKLAELERALEAGTTLGEAQRAADKITREGGTFARQRDKAKAIEDPEVRKEALALIEHEEIVQTRMRREDEEKRMVDAYNIIDRTKGVTGIAPDLWASFDGPTRSAMHHYAKLLAAGNGIKTDIETYQALLDQAANDPTTFNTQNLLNYRHKLDDTEYKQIASLQLSLRQGDRKATEEALGGYRTEAAIINTALEQAGIDPSDKKKAGPVAFLRQQVAEKAAALTALHGKKPTNADIQGIVDSILQQPVTTPGSWWALVNPIGYDLGDQSKRLIDLTISDVPKADRAQIEQALKARGWIVNDANILDTYLRHQSRTGRR